MDSRILRVLTGFNVMNDYWFGFIIGFLCAIPAVLFIGYLAFALWALFNFRIGTR